MPFSLVPGIFNSVISLALNTEAVLLFAGDAMQHKAQLDAAALGNGDYSFVECFDPVRDIISSADLAVVNLETPLGGKPYRGYPCFSAPDSYAEALIETGFDLFLTANNHTLDARDRGLNRTISVLDSLCVPHIGTYYNSNHRIENIPCVINVKGFKVGFLNYTYGTNGISPQGKVVVDYIDKKVIENDINATRNAGAEIICVAVHWGEEYKLLPNDSQKKLAKWLCDHGVDIIFGGHPHVIQPMELIENASTGKKTAVFYSLGNFISNMKTRDTRGGAISRVTLRRNSDGVAYVDDLDYQLVFTVVPHREQSNFKLYPVNAIIFESDSTTLKNDGSTTICNFPENTKIQCKDFVSSATKIFNKYNVNVTSYKSK